MAYLYNNEKLTITIKNGEEKEKMMKKLALVNRQVKKWNSTVFDKSSEDKKKKNKKPLEIESKEEIKEKIHEVDAHLEEDRALPTSSAFEDNKEEVEKDKEVKEQIKKAEEREEAMKREKKREEMRELDLVNDLVDDKLGIVWRIWIYATRHYTNQILLVFQFDKLNKIFEEVKQGTIKIYTELEEKLLKDYQNDCQKAKELNLETTFDLHESDKSKLAENHTKGMKVLLAYYSLILNIIISNSSFFCYLFMVICMIMNGSFLSLVYPISIFIYALLEEKRPSKKYWLFILYYTASVLVLKFLFQTYPLSQWITDPFVVSTIDNPQQVPTVNNVNDYFRVFRIGLENVEDSGRKFVNYFMFETFILLSVTLHIFILVFGGVWTQREVEAENIDQAASRIGIYS